MKQRSKSSLKKPKRRPAKRARRNLARSNGGTGSPARRSGTRRTGNGPDGIEGLADTSACTCFALRKAARTVTQVFDGFMKPSRLMITQFSMLSALAQAGPLPMNELASMLATDRTTLTRNLRPLLRAGFVSVERGTDRRVRIVTLTTKGAAALSDALPMWRHAQNYIVGKLGRRRWHDLLGALDAALEATRTH